MQKIQLKKIGYISRSLGLFFVICYESDDDDGAFSRAISSVFCVSLSLIIGNPSGVFNSLLIRLRDVCIRVYTKRN